jgi:hypothetical protein
LGTSPFDEPSLEASESFVGRNPGLALPAQELLGIMAQLRYEGQVKLGTLVFRNAPEELLGEPHPLEGRELESALEEITGGVGHGLAP